MAAEEAKLPAGERIDFVVTPNHLHVPMAKGFLDSGFNVVCDKPMTPDLDEAPEPRGAGGKSRGQPEGAIAAFANVYLEAGRAIRAETSGQSIPEGCDFPDVEDGVAVMAFVETAVESATNGGAGTKMKGT